MGKSQYISKIVHFNEDRISLFGLDVRIESFEFLGRVYHRLDVLFDQIDEWVKRSIGIESVTTCVSAKLDINLSKEVFTERELRRLLTGIGCYILFKCYTDEGNIWNDYFVPEVRLIVKSRAVAYVYNCILHEMYPDTRYQMDIKMDAEGIIVSIKDSGSKQFASLKAAGVYVVPTGTGFNPETDQFDLPLSEILNEKGRLVRIQVKSKKYNFNFC